MARLFALLLFALLPTMAVAGLFVLMGTRGPIAAVCAVGIVIGAYAASRLGKP